MFAYMEQSGASDDLQPMLGTLELDGRFSAVPLGDPSPEFGYITLSHDAKKAAVELLVSDPQSADVIWDKIVVMNVDGTGSVEINKEEFRGYLEYPAFSPDGTRLVWVSQTGDLMTDDAGGTWPAPVMLQDSIGGLVFWDAAFSPDQTQIVASASGDINGNAWGLNIWVMNVDGSGLVNITNNLDQDLGLRFPVFSPDGMKILYTQLDREPETHAVRTCAIYRMDPQGGSRELLTDTGYDLFPRFVQDQNVVTFQSYRDGNMQIYRMTPEGAGLAKLTDSPYFDGFGMEYNYLTQPAAASNSTYYLKQNLRDAIGIRSRRALVER